MFALIFLETFLIWKARHNCLRVKIFYTIEARFSNRLIRLKWYYGLKEKHFVSSPVKQLIRSWLTKLPGLNSFLKSVCVWIQRYFPLEYTYTRTAAFWVKVQVYRVDSRLTDCLDGAAVAYTAMLEALGSIARSIFYLYHSVGSHWIGS